MTHQTLLSVKSLSRHYRSQIAVNDLSFTINKGEVLGFLGPNGAGKSTTMKMLSGNLAPTYGEIIINGHDLLSDPEQAKQHIGYLAEQPPLYKELTVKEFLIFCANINNVEKAKVKLAVDSAIHRCGLSEVTQRLIANLSKGYQQRVGIAQAIIHSPAVVILDEPTSGLDPIQIREIRQLIRDIAREHSVILSTHILPEVQMLCDRVQIINQGQLIFSDHISALDEKMQSSCVLVSFLSPPDLSRLNNISAVSHAESIGNNQFRLHYAPDDDPLEEIVSQAVSNKWQLRELTPERHSLEDVFMKMIQDEQAN